MAEEYIRLAIKAGELVFHDEVLDESEDLPAGQERYYRLYKATKPTVYDEKVGEHGSEGTM